MSADDISENYKKATAAVDVCNIQLTERTEECSGNSVS